MKTNVPFTRIGRVQAWLDRDDRFKTRKETVTLEKSGKSQAYSKDALNIAQAMLGQGVDPCYVKKKEMMGWIEHIIFGGPSVKTDQATPPADADVKTAPPREAPSPAVAEDHRSYINLPVEVAVYTLLLSAYNLAAMYDRKPGADKRKQSIDTLAKEYFSLIRKKAPADVVATPSSEADEQSQDDDSDSRASVTAVVPSPA